MEAEVTMNIYDFNLNITHCYLTEIVPKCLYHDYDIIKAVI